MNVLFNRSTGKTSVFLLDLENTKEEFDLNGLFALRSLKKLLGDSINSQAKTK